MPNVGHWAVKSLARKVGGHAGTRAAPCSPQIEKHECVHEKEHLLEIGRHCIQLPA